MPGFKYSPNFPDKLYYTLYCAALYCWHLTLNQFNGCLTLGTGCGMITAGATGWCPGIISPDHPTIIHCTILYCILLNCTLLYSSELDINILYQYCSAVHTPHCLAGCQPSQFPKRRGQARSHSWISCSETLNSFVNYNPPQFGTFCP